MRRWMVAWAGLGVVGLVAVLGAGRVLAQGAPPGIDAPPSIDGSAGGGSDWTSPTLGKMKWIKPGSFTMGSPAGEAGRGDDETQHRVTLTKGFLLMEHEVTQGEWQAVMGSNPSRFTSCGATCPVEMVSWDDIQTFIQKVSARDGVKYRLPTEAEWEYAARGGQSYVYAGSNEIDAVAWYGGNSGFTTHPVCQKQRNGYGLCDMTGNVWEWVQDWYGTYPGDTSDYLNNGSGPGRVIRGGSWRDNPGIARVALRTKGRPDGRSYAIGFRLARSL